jgi:hypothetical protein
VRKAFLLLVGAAAAALTFSSCDASPYAASVNGHDISVAYLYNQLKQWSANRAWVTSFDSANSSANGGSGTTVAGSGGPSTYSSTFTADILDTIVEFDIVHDYLEAHGRQPSPDELIAARAVNEYLRADYWEQFSPALRQFLVEQLADEALLVPRSTDQATIRSAYSQIEPYLFSQVCLDEASATTQAAAEVLSFSAKVNGVTVCFDQAALEGEPAGFRQAVLKLSPGEVSQPIRVSYGYQVVQLVSRKAPGLSAGVEQVLSAATATSEPPALSRLLSGAKVKVNPEFGTWSKGQIVPPRPVGGT